jgi:hypothetical protein
MELAVPVAAAMPASTERGHTRLDFLVNHVLLYVAHLRELLRGGRSPSSVPPASAGAGWPLPHVRLGVPVADPARADERTPRPCTRAALRFFSAGPLCRCDVAVENPAHGATFPENNAPSKPGIKHVGYPSSGVPVALSAIYAPARGSAVAL